MIIYTKTVKEFGNELNKLIDMQIAKDKLLSIIASLQDYTDHLARNRDSMEFIHPAQYEKNNTFYNEWIDMVNGDIQYLYSLLDREEEEEAYTTIMALDAEGIRPVY